MTYSKDFIGIIAVILTIVGFVPYIKSIIIGETKPHVFSWVIWGITTFIVFLAQLSDKGGAGAWSIGLSGVITTFVAFLAYTKKADITISKTDWIFFIFSLLALPIWYLTSSPFWSVFILTMVDVVGFFPTIRKAYVKPFEEKISLYFIIVARNITSILALEHYSTITLLFPIAITLVILVFIAVVMYRRSLVKPAI